jgi:hypothetical protein
MPDMIGIAGEDAPVWVDVVGAQLAVRQISPVGNISSIIRRMLIKRNIHQHSVGREASPS